MSDREAIKEIKLYDLLDNLPSLYCGIADCAYMPTEHLVPIFGGAQARIPKNNNFNFYASQLRIRIEMAFQMMVMK